MAAALAVAVLAGCADEDGAVRPLADEVRPAIEAVEAERGGPQRYFEVNATPQFVNLFVQDELTGDVVTYLYVDGELQPPTPPEGVQEGAGTFAAADLVGDLDVLFAEVDEDLAGSDIVVLYVLGDGTGAVQYHLVVESERGGRLDVLVGPDGRVVSVDPDSAPSTTS